MAVAQQQQQIGKWGAAERAVSTCGSSEFLLWRVTLTKILKEEQALLLLLGSSGLVEEAQALLMLLILSCLVARPGACSRCHPH